MSKDVEVMKAALGKIRQDPMVTRRVAQVLMDASVLLDKLDRDLDVANFGLKKCREARDKDILRADEGALLGEVEVQPTPKKRGRPSKNAQEVQDK